MIRGSELRVCSGLGGCLSSVPAQLFGDADLDERAGTGGIGDVGKSFGILTMQHTQIDDLPQRIDLMFELPLDIPLGVDPACLVSIEAMVERVLEVVHMEVGRTAIIRAIQKRTVMFVFIHADPPRRTLLNYRRGGAKSMNRLGGVGSLAPYSLQGLQLLRLAERHVTLCFRGMVQLQMQVQHLL